MKMIQEQDSEDDLDLYCEKAIEESFD